MWERSVVVVENVTYVLVIDAFEQHQFSVGSLGVGLVLKRPAELFYSYRDAQDSVQSRA